jgi:hypothetical protein
MTLSHLTFDKCRIFRLRQFQGQNYLIGRMSAVALSPTAAKAWLLFDGRRALGEIAVKLGLDTGRPADVVLRELSAMAILLQEKEALKAALTSTKDTAGGEITVEETRIPKALLWGGYNN